MNIRMTNSFRNIPNQERKIVYFTKEELTKIIKDFMSKPAESMLIELYVPRCSFHFQIIITKHELKLLHSPCDIIYIRIKENLTKDLLIYLYGDDHNTQ